MDSANWLPSSTNSCSPADGIEGQTTSNETVENDNWHVAKKLKPAQKISRYGYRMSLLAIASLDLFSVYWLHSVDKQAGSTLPTALEAYVVKPQDLSREIKINGKLDYGDGQLVTLRAPMTGRVEMDVARSVGDWVTEAEGLLTIRSDHLLEGERNFLRALEDFELAKQNSDGFAMVSSQKSLSAERRNLLLLGVSPERLTEVEKLNVVSDRLPVESRESGIILDTRVHEGQKVHQGDIMYRIVNPDLMWLFASVHVSDLHWITVGRRAAIRVKTQPAIILRSVVTVMSPVVDSASRTVRIGIPLPNEDGKLQRFMSASATFQIGVQSDGRPEPTGLEGKYICATHPDLVRESPGDCPISGSLLAHVANRREERNPATESMILAIPVGAVLDRDGRKSVRRVTSSGKIEIVEIKIGVPAQGKDDQGEQTTYFPVQAGLKEGDRVLVSPNVGLEGEMLIGE